MKKYMFIALTLLVAACEKPILDEEDAVTRKEANVILSSVREAYPRRRGCSHEKRGECHPAYDAV